MAKSTFGDDFENFSLAFIGASEEAVRASTYSIWDDIIKASPVMDGRFRANWVATGKKPSTRTTADEDKKGDSTSDKARAVVFALKDWSEFNLTNNLPYANVIEFGLYGDGPNTINGYSTQAKHGVVRVNMARVKANLEAEFKKRAPK